LLSQWLASVQYVIDQVLLIYSYEVIAHFIFVGLSFTSHLACLIAHPYSDVAGFVISFC
jgi:hypothetical protein